MAHTDTYIDGSLPFGIARVAAVTGNPMQDIGYQCRDSRPYFGFAIASSLLAYPEFYTTLAPAKATTETTVNVYTLGSIEVDGVTYDAMTLVGTGTQNGTALVYNSFRYSYRSNVAIREFNINKWAKYKPQAVDKLSPITDAERAAATYGITASRTLSYSGLHDQTYTYTSVPGDGDIARLTDFAGYNHEAALDLSATITADIASRLPLATALGGSTVTVTVTFTSDTSKEGSLTFAELIEALSGTPLTSCYPHLLASMMDEDELTYEAHYICALKQDDAVSQFNTMSGWQADLSETSGFVSGRKWKLTVFFSPTLLYDGDWTDVSLILAVGTLAAYILPGATTEVTVSSISSGGSIGGGTGGGTGVEELSPMEATSLELYTGAQYSLTFEWPEGYDEDTTYWATVAVTEATTTTISDIVSDTNNSGEYTNSTTERISLLAVVGGTTVTVTCYGSKGDQEETFGVYTFTI